jgi:hypothetical protein
MLYLKSWISGQINSTYASLSGMALTDNERKQALTKTITTMVSQEGWKIEYREDFMAVLVQSHLESLHLQHAKEVKTNHLLHLILTLVTFGLWGLVWIFMTIGHYGQKSQLQAKQDQHRQHAQQTGRAVLVVDQNGNCERQQSVQSVDKNPNAVKAWFNNFSLLLRVLIVLVGFVIFIMIIIFLTMPG